MERELMIYRTQAGPQPLGAKGALSGLGVSVPIPYHRQPASSPNVNRLRWQGTKGVVESNGSELSTGWRVARDGKCNKCIFSLTAKSGEAFAQDFDQRITDCFNVHNPSIESQNELCLCLWRRSMCPRRMGRNINGSRKFERRLL